MRYLYALFFVFLLSNTLADSNFLFLKCINTSRDYIDYLTHLTKSEYSLLQTGKVFSYNDYAANRIEKNKNWDMLVLDESRKPKSEKQKLHLKKIDNKQPIKYYNFWNYLDDIMNLHAVPPINDIHNGFLNDTQKAKQIVRLNVSLERKFDYQISVQKTEHAISTVFTALKPVLFDIYNKSITFCSAILSLFGVEIEWKYFVSRHYLKYGEKKADGFLED